MKLNQSLYYRLHRKTEKQTVIPNPQSGSMMRYVNGKEENQVWGVAGKPTKQINSEETAMEGLDTEVTMVRMKAMLGSRYMICSMSEISNMKSSVLAFSKPPSV